MLGTGPLNSVTDMIQAAAQRLYSTAAKRMKSPRTEVGAVAVADLVLRKCQSDIGGRQPGDKPCLLVLINLRFDFRYY